MAHNASETRNYKTPNGAQRREQSRNQKRRAAAAAKRRAKLLEDDDDSVGNCKINWWTIRWWFSTIKEDGNENNIPRCHVGVVPPQKNTFEGRLYIEISIGCKYRGQYELDIRADVLERV